MKVEAAVVSGTPPNQAAIGLGSNLDRPAEQVRRALDALRSLPRTRLLRHSALYLSPPWGKLDQPWFVNAAAVVETELGAETLHVALKAIEDDFGRRRDGERWGPRVIDLDLLLFDARVIVSEQLTVPHPRMLERPFVLVPLAEIAAEWPLPGGGSVASACAALAAEQRHLRRVDSASAV